MAATGSRRKTTFIPIFLCIVITWMFRWRTTVALVTHYSLQHLRRPSLYPLRKMSSIKADIDTVEKEKRNLVIVIAGPTGVGKSDVAARICQDLKGFIISADSVQAYRHVQVGANKPSLEERKQTPHILIDVADHTENYNAADWREDAIYSIQSLLNQEHDKDVDSNHPRKQAIDESIRQARKEKGYTKDEQLLPVVCGGTMMYLGWLCKGSPDAIRPTKDALSKAKEIVEDFQRKNDWEGAVEHVSSMGDVFQERCTGFCGLDWYRLRRTLEVALTVAEADNKDEMQEKLYSGLRKGGLEDLGYDVRCFFLCPDQRMNHTKVIDQRCEQMLMKGLLKETADLVIAGTLPEMAKKAIGYRQVLDYLNRENPGLNEEEEFNNFLAEFAAVTRRYAKQQMSWFRKDGGFMFVPVPSAAEKQERIAAATREVLRLCNLDRGAYDTELKDDDSLSAKTINNNEEQGKKMKYYHFDVQLLKAGTPELDQVLQEACECTQRIQSSKKPRTIE
jgi:tRNA dimethylallyltransferase